MVVNHRCDPISFKTVIGRRPFPLKQASNFNFYYIYFHLFIAIAIYYYFLLLFIAKIIKFSERKAIFINGTSFV